jgi:hypothetical protein
MNILYYIITTWLLSIRRSGLSELTLVQLHTLSRMQIMLFFYYIITSAANMECYPDNLL